MAFQINELCYVWFIIIVIASNVSHTYSDCSPCKCEYDQGYKGNTMKCMGSTDYDLGQVFETYTKNLTAAERQFKMFYFNNTFITEIKDQAFKGLTFEWIRIEEATSLERIGSNAFNNETNYVTKSIRINSNPKLSNPDNSLFEALSRFVVIEDIDVTYNDLEEIPSNAFKPLNGYQTKLRDIIICDNSLTTLGEKAFWSIPDLRSLLLYDTGISHIPDNAFAFEKPSKQNLTIMLSPNYSMKSSSFSVNSLSGVGRPTELLLGHKYTPNQTQYLDEQTFRPFLMADKFNKINLNGEAFDCDDCRSYWLARDADLSTRLDEVLCSNGNEFNDTKNFVKCQ